MHTRVPGVAGTVYQARYDVYRFGGAELTDKGPASPLHRSVVAHRDGGGVEMHVEGDEAAVERMLEWAQEGPAHASVETVEARDVAAQGGLDFVEL